MEYEDYINPEKWIGGFFELSIEYHPSGDPIKLNDALDSLYKSDIFHGMWIEKSDYCMAPVPLPIHVEEDSVQLFYGLLSLTTDIHLPCVISIIRVHGESDWLDISIPQAIFEERFPYKYPLTKELNPWLSLIIEMYAKLAETIFKCSPFTIAIIGEEVSGANISEINVEHVTLITPSQLQSKIGLDRKEKIDIKRVSNTLNSWRITKYDPLNRDADRIYLDLEEWTCFSEVGTKVSLEEYQKQEEKYIHAITTFVVEMGLNRVYVTALEQWSDEVRNQDANDFLSKIWVGKAVTTEEVRELARLTLRNAIWCKLEYKKQFFVHFGYDYYMFIGASEDCAEAKEVVTKTGLFIEDFQSPYLTK